MEIHIDKNATCFYYDHDHMKPEGFLCLRLQRLQLMLWEVWRGVTWSLVFGSVPSKRGAVRCCGVVAKSQPRKFITIILSGTNTYKQY